MKTHYTEKKEALRKNLMNLFFVFLLGKIVSLGR